MSGPTGTPVPSAPPPTPWGSESAEVYVEANLDRFTPAALEAALVAAGYDAASAREAIRRGEARRKVAPGRATARVVVVGAYLLTYAALVAALLVSSSYGGGYGMLAALILTGALGVAFVISAVWLRWRRPVALWAMVSVPLILLVVVGGACYMTTLYRPGAV